MAKTLSYEQTEPLPPPGLHLQDLGDHVRLMRVPRRWEGLMVQVVGPAIGVAVMCAVIAMLASMVWLFYSMGMTYFTLLTVLLSIALYAALIAVFLMQLLSFRRRGISFPVLEATASGVELRAPAMLWGVSRRHWPVGEIESIDLRHLRDVFGRSHVVVLRIRITGRWTALTMRLSHQDPEFPDQAAAAFRRVLGMEADEVKRV